MVASTLRVLLCGFRAKCIHSYFVFVGDIASQRLASRRSPALSWFFAVAEQTFEYVSKLKLNFGLWNLNLVPIICCAYSASAQWAFDPRRRTDGGLSKVE
jgi:hypothetical protein